MESLNDDLILKIINEFQYIENGKVKTDIKNVLKLANCSSLIYNFITNSNLMKIFWTNYYNSLFLSEMDGKTEHTGEQTWINCGNFLYDKNMRKMKYPGIKNMYKNVTTEYRCKNPLHYTINNRCRFYWGTKKILEKIFLRKFEIRSSNSSYFIIIEEDIEERLDNLYIKKEIIKAEIDLLERRKRDYRTNLAELYKDYITEEQVVSYYQHKNQTHFINESS